mgnify:FL=1
MEFRLWSMLYLEGWSSRSSYFIGVALHNPRIGDWSSLINLIKSSHHAP